MMSNSFKIFFSINRIDYWLSVIEKVNGCIQGACDSVSKWM